MNRGGTNKSHSAGGARQPTSERRWNQEKLLSYDSNGKVLLLDAPDAPEANPGMAEKKLAFRKILSKYTDIVVHALMPVTLGYPML